MSISALTFGIVSHLVLDIFAGLRHRFTSIFFTREDAKQENVEAFVAVG